MNWLQRFMQGRYGADQLNLALLVLAILCSILSGLLRWHWLQWLAWLFLLLGIFRMLSRDTNRRWLENDRFLRLIQPVRGWSRQQRSRWAERHTHKRFHCPQCKQMVRVPRGEGKICSTCPKCGAEFIKKT